TAARASRASTRMCPTAPPPAASATSRLASVTSDGRAVELADRAWRAAEADEADARLQVEESGFARFPGSEVHQPTLISDESITLRVVRDGKVGCAVTNRTDDEGLREGARRAGEARGRQTPARRRTALPT